MNMTSLLVRALMLAVFATGVVTVAAFNRGEHASTAPVAIIVAARAASNTVELPTVTVRPSAAEIAEAMREDSSFQVAHAISTSHTRSSRASRTLPSLGLDMPYYSFGKAMPRVSKE
jgi:hypothetical protein